MCPPLGDQTNFMPGNVGSPGGVSGGSAAGSFPQGQNQPSGVAASPALTSPPGSAASPPSTYARAWGENALQQVLLTTNPTIVAAATITPQVTGKVRVTISGTVNNTGGAVSLIASVTHGLGVASPADYTQGTQTVAGGSLSETQSLVVDFDSKGIIFPTGTAVVINAVLQAGGGNVVVVPAHGIQIELQEVP